VVLTIGVLAGACAPPSDAAAPTATARQTIAASPTASTTRSIPVVRLPLAEPAERVEAAIAIAFDPSAASDLAQDLPDDLDWGATGLVCVYLGRRVEGGWGLTIQSASLVGGELRILARETRPTPGVDRPGPTYPADCATIARAVLPTGPLPARADDTISDEFIVSSELQVPAR